jgi:hypothetical protein
MPVPDTGICTDKKMAGTPMWVVTSPILDHKLLLSHIYHFSCYRLRIRYWKATN